MNGLNWLQRIHEPAPSRLATLNPTASATSAVRAFIIPLPDMRVQVKAAFIAGPAGAPPAGTTIPYDVTFGGNISVLLWLAVAERQPDTGIYLPTGNLVGTRLAPQAIPLDISLMGYSEDAVAGADALIGEVTIAHSGAGPGTPPITTWWLKTRYQPVSGALFSEAEWTQIVGAATPSVPGAPLVAGSPP